VLLAHQIAPDAGAARGATLKKTSREEGRAKIQRAAGVQAQQQQQRACHASGTTGQTGIRKPGGAAPPPTSFA
jgi:hypothetical protein